MAWQVNTFVVQMKKGIDMSYIVTTVEKKPADVAFYEFPAEYISATDALRASLGDKLINRALQQQPGKDTKVSIVVYTKQADYDELNTLRSGNPTIVAVIAAREAYNTAHNIVRTITTMTA